jgi:hypothetical protein
MEARAPRGRITDYRDDCSADEPSESFTRSSPAALSLNHQARIRKLYPEQCSSQRPGSSSSGSLTDWDSGHNTVLRRQPLPALPATVLERLSVRTELGTGGTTPRKPPQQVLGPEIKPEALQCPELGHQQQQQQPQQNHHQHLHHGMVRSLATSLTSLTRELTPTISEVYHERNLGLGLAPSLSKLLEEVGSEAGEAQRIGARSAAQSQTADWLQGEAELCRRDEADGRSIAESQCSATSSNKIRRKAPPPPV